MSKRIAKKIIDELFELGSSHIKLTDGRIVENPCWRIAFKGGRYEDETDNGGMDRAAMDRWMTEQLRGIKTCRCAGRIMITEKQAEAFNRMRAVLNKIAKIYMTTDQIRRDAEKGVIDYEEYLEMAYENVQGEAKYAVKGVRKLKT